MKWSKLDVHFQIFKRFFVWVFLFWFWIFIIVSYHFMATDVIIREWQKYGWWFWMLFETCFMVCVWIVEIVPLWLRMRSNWFKDIVFTYMVGVQSWFHVFCILEEEIFLMLSREIGFGLFQNIPHVCAVLFSSIRS